MKNQLQVALRCTPEQIARLRALQLLFCEACNALAPIVRDTRCWNRVALHHMTYRMLRERFPQLGSQMACNAIYSVSRTCRAIYQSPNSPFNVARMGARPLATIRFEPTAPVYFDRHTLSLKEGRLSMFTLDGRMRFDVGLSPADEQRFHNEKLLEILLSSRQDVFVLTFVLGAADSGDAATLSVEAGEPGPVPVPVADPLPDYLQVLPAAQAAPEGAPA